MSSTKSRTANHLSSSYESQQESTFCGRVLALELFPNPYTHCKTKTQQIDRLYIGLHSQPIYETASTTLST